MPLQMTHEDHNNMMDPLAPYYAQQAAAYAANAPSNPQAQRTAQYWAAIAQAASQGHSIPAPMQLWI